jgi:hypothetical protein
MFRDSGGVNRNLPLAIDDKVAVKRAQRFRPAIAIESTESLMVSLIHAGVLDLSAADAIKQDWEQNHRFRLDCGIVLA